MGLLIPQFVRPHAGATWFQFLQLGVVQIAIAIAVNGLIVLAAANAAGYLTHHPAAKKAQRLAAGTVLGGFAVKIVSSARP